ncbi:MAG: hypothetical protein RMI91_02895 [Gemmatales bacterium]|nr:hypothetical protein [Gemmatales bacterium]MDW7993576.1 hypothetical protein [Gemmatales bacterium]
MSEGSPTHQGRTLRPPGSDPFTASSPQFLAGRPKELSHTEAFDRS